MPEGHTIHRLARDHTRDFVGQQLQISSPQGRFAEEAKLLNGRMLESVDAHGKHLFYHWAKSARRRATILHVHLGLYGKFKTHKLPAPEPRGAVRVRVVGEKKMFDLRGPNTCELLDHNEMAAILDRLGPDPLRKSAGRAIDAEQKRS